MELKPTKWTYAGTFIVSCSLLMLEILLTRIFTVTMLYHYAFAAISLAMFGITVGSLAVYLYPSFFTYERTAHHLSLSAMLLSIAIVISILTHFSIPLIPEVSFQAAYTMSINYLVMSFPFFFGGICISLLLTRFPSHVGRLYAADLVGASCGCLLTIYFIEFTDGPSSVLITGLFAATAALCFGQEGSSPRFVKVLCGCALLLGSFGLGNAILAASGMPLLRVTWVDGEREPPGLYEKWNSFARIKVTGNPNEPRPTHGWGLSPVYPRDRLLRSLYIRINNVSGSYMTAFDGDLSRLEHLKYELVNLVHYIRPNSTVMAIGVGGGTDILSALVFGQKSIVGVDVNGDILNAVNRQFGDFTGHLDKNPKVKFIHDEARSYIGRSKERYDVIQSRAIERPKAKLDGALVLAENSLYTVEAWKTLLQHLSSHGVLTFTLTHNPGTPQELYRLASLATAALAEAGVKNPRGHVMIARLLPSLVFFARGGGDAWPSAAILVCKEPFSAEEVNTIAEVCDRVGFELLLTPTFAADPNFELIVSPEGRKNPDRVSPWADIRPPTDDRPFFFNMLRLSDLFNPESWKYDTNRVGSNLKSIFILLSLLATVVVLTVACIFVPLAVRGDRTELWGASPLVGYFAAIGFGFMLVEISQMQRLIIYLGDPTYGLSSVLFSLLLSSGIGSYVSALFGRRGWSTSNAWPLALIPVTLTLFGLLTPHVIDSSRHMETIFRILVAVATLFSIGFFMGMAFPLGMALASGVRPALTPWLWGINGATSVVGSVLAYTITLFAGISATFWVGVVCYLAALAAFILAVRTSVPREQTAAS